MAVRRSECLEFPLIRSARSAYTGVSGMILLPRTDVSRPLLTYDPHSAGANGSAVSPDPELASVGHGLKLHRLSDRSGRSGRSSAPVGRCFPPETTAAVCRSGYDCPATFV